MTDSLAPTSPSLPGSKPSTRKGLTDNSANPVKGQFVECRNIGMVVVCTMTSGEAFFGQVSKVVAERGCTGNTFLTLAVRDGSERVVSWREGLVASLRPPTMAELLEGMLGL